MEKDANIYVLSCIWSIFFIVNNSKQKNYITNLRSIFEVNFIVVCALGNRSTKILKILIFSENFGGSITNEARINQRVNYFFLRISIFFLTIAET